MKKKGLSLAIYIIALLCVLGLTVGYAIAPDAVSNLLDKIGEFLKHPFVVAGYTVTLGGIVGYLITKYVFSNTKFGKREISNMHDEITTFKSDVSEDFNKANEKVNNAIATLDEKANEYKEDFENRVTVLINEFDNLQHNMLDALKTIPNKKVQDVVTKYEAEYESKKQEFIQKAIDGNKYIDDKLAEIRNEYDNMFNELKDKVEGMLHEEERVDIETAEE